MEFAIVLGVVLGVLVGINKRQKRYLHETWT